MSHFQELQQKISLSEDRKEKYINPAHPISLKAIAGYTRR